MIAFNSDNYLEGQINTSPLTIKLLRTCQCSAVQCSVLCNIWTCWWIPALSSACRLPPAVILIISQLVIHSSTQKDWTWQTKNVKPVSDTVKSQPVGSCIYILVPPPSSLPSSSNVKVILTSEQVWGSWIIFIKTTEPDLQIYNKKYIL